MKSLLRTQGAFFLLLGRAANELWHFARLPLARSNRPGTLAFACNLCGRTGALDLSGLQREERTCLGCGSTLRQRSLIAALSRKLFDGQSMPLPEWPPVQHLDARGISDSELIDRALSQRMRYRNTYIHREPILDLCSPAEGDVASCDILICSDVLEHVAPPLERAFAGMRRIVRPGGFALITVPCSAQKDTTEHFPNLHEYRIIERNGKRVLANLTADSRYEVFEELVFHGGPGETLEMRRLALPDLERHLNAAGFSRVEICAQPAFEHGVYWHEPYSVPIIAS